MDNFLKEVGKLLAIWAGLLLWSELISFENMVVFILAVLVYRINSLS